MHKHLQPILFFTFVVAFLITAPLVVLYTAGFRYQFGKNVIVKTGVLSVSTIPRGATLLIDETEESTKTPVVVDTIIPGMHKITLQKEGYLPWKKELEVFSQLTTFADNVVLFGSDELVFDSKLKPQEVQTASAPTTTFQGKQVQINSLPDRAVLSFVDSSDVSTIISYLPAGTYSFVPAPANLLFLVDELHQRIVVINPQDDQPVLLNESASVFDWQLDRSRLLFSDGFDLQVYNASNHTRETLTRLSEKIVDLAWFPKGEVVLYATDTHVTALELDRRGSQNRFELGTLDRIDSFSLDDQGQTLTVLGKLASDEGTFQKRLQN